MRHGRQEAALRLIRRLGVLTRVDHFRDVHAKADGEAAGGPALANLYPAPAIECLQQHRTLLCMLLEPAPDPFIFAPGGVRKLAMCGTIAQQGLECGTEADDRFHPGMHLPVFVVAENQAVVVIEDHEGFIERLHRTDQQFALTGYLAIGMLTLDLVGAPARQEIDELAIVLVELSVVALRRPERQRAVPLPTDADRHRNQGAIAAIGRSHQVLHGRDIGQDPLAPARAGDRRQFRETGNHFDPITVGDQPAVRHAQPGAGHVDALGESIGQGFAVDAVECIEHGQPGHLPPPRPFQTTSVGDVADDPQHQVTAVDVHRTRAHFDVTQLAGGEQMTAAHHLPLAADVHAQRVFGFFVMQCVEFADAHAPHGGNVIPIEFGGCPIDVDQLATGKGIEQQHR